MNRYTLTLFALLLIAAFVIAGCTPSSSATAQKVKTQIPSVPSMPYTIAFDSDRDGNREVYRMAPDGSDTVNLTNDPGDDTGPDWSPDASQIAFVSNRINGREGGQFIYVMDPE
jgi:Tol biopolymer transport system component